MHSSTVPSHEPPRHHDFRSALQFFLIDCTTLPGKLIDILIVCLNLAVCIIFFISSILFYEVEHPVNAGVSTFTDAFYFTVVALTTVGFGDITPLSEGGKWVTILMILSGIILIPWQISRIVREWIRFARKRDIVCPQCGLRYHDDDASHCKSCGHVIYQEYEGN